MAEIALLIKELLAMDLSLVDITIAGMFLIATWKLPDIIKAIK